MTLADSLMISLFGMAVVFLVLILLSFLVKLQSVVVAYIMAHNHKLDAAATNNTVPVSVDVGWSTGELKLLGVDERTAAMIMAIVSDESQIPLSELQFKMIKAIN